MKWISCFFLVCIAASCIDTSAGSDAHEGIIVSKKNRSQDCSKAFKDSIKKLLEINLEERDSILLVNNLVDVQSINSAIYVDLKYATMDNFMKIILIKKLYGTVYIQIRIFHHYSSKNIINHVLVFKHIMT